MNNSTNNGNDTPQNLVQQQFLGYIFAGLLLVIGVYVLAATIIYEVAMARKNCQCRISHLQSKVTMEKSAIMRYPLLCGLVLAVIRQILEFVELNIAFYSDEGCNNLRITKNILYAVIIALPYIVLFYRQKKCYESPVLFVSSNAVTRFLSKTIIIVMILGDIIALALFLFTRSYISSYRGCIVGYNRIWKKLPGVVLLSCTVTFQAALLALFLFPIYKNRKSSRDFGIPDAPNISALMKRIAVATVVNICVDAVSAGVASRLDYSFHTADRQLIYDAAMISLFLCVIAGFKDWRFRLCPFLIGQNVPEQTPLQFAEQSRTTTV